MASINRISNAVASAGGWQRMVLAFVAGAASVLAIAPFFLAPVLFLTLPCLVWLIDGASRQDTGDRRRQALTAAASGWFFGFGYFSSGLFWVGEAFLVEAEKFAWAMPFAVTLLPAGLALFYAMAAGLARLIWPSGRARVVVLAAALSAAEWLRGNILTGFPWNTLGYALTWPETLMQSSGLLGIYALTLWSVIIAALPLVALATPAGEPDARHRRIAGLTVPAAMFTLLWGYGSYRLFLVPEPDVAGVKLRIVQVSVPQKEKWLPVNQPRIFADHVNFSFHNAAGEKDDLDGITHVVWPEAAMAFLPLEHPEVLEKLGEMLPDGAALITGALRRENDQSDGNGDLSNGLAPTLPRQRVFNSLLVIDSEGRLAGLYDKIHLVPFGEYLPAQTTLESIGLRQLTRLRGGFAAGDEPRPLLDVGRLELIAGLICYEAIFPDEILNSRQRPSIYLNVTNDGWFGNTTGPRQHFHQARVRAVETGVPLVRAANNGISAMIDAHGRVLGRLELDEKGILDASVPGRLPPPLYARFADGILLAHLLLVIVGGLFFARFRRASAA